MQTQKKIVVVSVTKVESDIIESFVRHSFSFADEMLIADNGSHDGAKEILINLQTEGLPLHVKEFSYRAEFDHASMMLSLVREAVSDYGADVVLPLDIDEFLVNTENDIPCRRILQALDTDKTYMLHMSLYVPLEPYEDSSKFLLAQPCKRESLDVFRPMKLIVGAELAKDEDFRLLQGCHEAYWDRPEGQERITWERVPFLHVAHYHWRSNERYAIKSVLGWTGMVSQYTKHSFVCSYMKTGYETVVRGEKEKFGNFDAITERIDLTKFCGQPFMHYGNLATADSEAILIEEFAHLAEAYAEEKALRRKREVGILLPFWGDLDALGDSLDVVFEQTYPYLQAYILNFTETVPDGLDELLEETPSLSLFACAGMDANALAAALSESVKADYIQWLLPGGALGANHIKKMVAVLELQDDYRYKFSFLFANHAQPSAGSLNPYMDVSHKGEIVFASNRQKLWHNILIQGKYPANGMDDVLIPRHILFARNWMAECLGAGGPHIFSMWRSLLRELPQDGETRNVCVIQEDDARIRPVSGGEYVGHQLEWIAILEEEAHMLSAEELNQALAQAIENYRRILFSHVPEDTEYMHIYKEIIRTIEQNWQGSGNAV